MSGDFFRYSLRAPFPLFLFAIRFCAEIENYRSPSAPICSANGQDKYKVHVERRAYTKGPLSSFNCVPYRKKSCGYITQNGFFKKEHHIFTILRLYDFRFRFHGQLLTLVDPLLPDEARRR